MKYRIEVEVPDELDLLKALQDRHVRLPVFNNGENRGGWYHVRVSSAERVMAPQNDPAQLALPVQP